MTNKELANGDLAGIVDALANEPANGLQTPERVLLREAAQRLRNMPKKFYTGEQVMRHYGADKMPEGEWIEGCEIGSAFIRDSYGGDSVTVKLPPDGSLHKMLLEPCTLTIHERKEAPQ